jgi:hypothetical protein
MSSIPENPIASLTNGAELPLLEPTQQSKAGKSKEEIYLELAKLCHESFENRQSYEWKIAFGLWTGIGLFTYFATVHVNGISGLALVGCAVAYFLLASVWLFAWQPTIHGGHASDKAWKHYYMHRAENRPKHCSAPDPWRDESKISWCQQQHERWYELRQLSALSQVIITAALLFLSFIIIQGSSSQAPVVQKKDTISVSGDNVTKVIDKLAK